MINTDEIKKIGIMLLGIALGAGAGELAQYVIWTVGDFAVTYCAVNAPPEWHELCLKNLGNYNGFKPYFQIVGVIVGVTVSITAVKKYLIKKKRLLIMAKNKTLSNSNAHSKELDKLTKTLQTRKIKVSKN